MDENAHALLVATQAIMPVIPVAQAIERYQEIIRFTSQLMEEGTDYGVIPGAGQKKILYKAGAEKLCTFFGLHAAFETPIVTEDWTGEDHAGEPFFYYQVRCRLTRNGEVVAEGLGSCNSFETKYRYRDAQRVCPTCGGTYIIKGKDEYGGGWLCFKKRGGCGAKFADDDPAITGQVIGKIPNPDVADLVNTLLKMATKRALIAAVLIAVNASALFTQDIEEQARHLPDPIEEGRKRLVRELMEIDPERYPSRRAVALAFQELGATYTLEDHDTIRKDLLAPVILG